MLGPLFRSIGVEHSGWHVGVQVVRETVMFDLFSLVRKGSTKLSSSLIGWALCLSAYSTSGVVCAAPNPQIEGGPLCLHQLLLAEDPQQPLIHLGTYLAETEIDADRIIERGKSDFLPLNRVMRTLLDQYGQHPARWPRLLTLKTVWNDLHQRAEQGDSEAIGLLADMGCPSSCSSEQLPEERDSMLTRLKQWWGTPTKEARIAALLAAGDSVETEQYLASVADLVPPNKEEQSSEISGGGSTSSSASGWSAKALTGLLLASWGASGAMSACPDILSTGGCASLQVKTECYSPAGLPVRGCLSRATCAALTNLTSCSVQAM